MSTIVLVRESTISATPAFGELEQHRAELTSYCYRMLGSPFDASLACEYRWPLYPEDNLGAVGSSIFGLLAECRLETVRVAETVWLAKAASH